MTCIGGDEMSDDIKALLEIGIDSSYTFVGPNGEACPLQLGGFP